MKVFEFLFAVLILNASINFQAEGANVDLKPCLSGKWVECGISVGKFVYTQYNSWSDTDTKQVFGTTCHSQFKSGFHSWQWKWSGKFWCPSLSTSIMGTSTQWKSRNGAIEHAIQDYVTKMTSAGLLKVEQLDQ